MIKTVIFKTLLGPCILATTGGALIGANVPHVKRAIHHVQRKAKALPIFHRKDREVITATTIATAAKCEPAPITLSAWTTPTSANGGSGTTSATPWTPGNGYPAYTTVRPTPFTPVSAIPEPTTWSLMIVGFGLTGYALRRRTVAFA